MKEILKALIKKMLKFFYKLFLFSYYIFRVCMHERKELTNMKKYRVSNPPSPSLASTGEYVLPSDRIQGTQDCIFCGSLTMSYRRVCNKCKWSVSPERLEILQRKRQGQIEAMQQERIDKANKEYSFASDKVELVDTREERVCSLCYLFSFNMKQTFMCFRTEVNICTDCKR